MKKRNLSVSLFFCLLFIIVISINVYADKFNPHKAIIGVWQGYNYGLKDTVTFVFNENGTGKTIRHGETIWSFEYKLNDNVRPMALDIIIPGQGKALAIIEFFTVNSMRIKMPFGAAERPKSFPDGKDDETVKFSRGKL